LEEAPWEPLLWLDDPPFGAQSAPLECDDEPPEAPCDEDDPPFEPQALLAEAAKPLPAERDALCDPELPELPPVLHAPEAPPTDFVIDCLPAVPNSKNQTHRARWSIERYGSFLRTLKDASQYENSLHWPKMRQG